MDSLSHVVIDEVDTMLDDSFSKDVLRVLSNIKVSLNGNIPQTIYNQSVSLIINLPNIVFLLTVSLQIIINKEPTITIFIG